MYTIVQYTKVYLRLSGFSVDSIDSSPPEIQFGDGLVLIDSRKDNYQLC